MEAKNYSFEKHSMNNSAYIFQIVKERILSDIYHSHDFYEFIAVMEGNCTQIINEQPVLCEKGDLILLCPGDKHKFIKQSDNVNILALSVKNQEVNEFEKLFCIENNPLKFLNIKLSSKQFRAITEFYHSKSEYDYKLLLANLIKIHTDSFNKNNALPEALEKAIKEMQKKENLKGGISRLVSLSGYSKTHLNRLLNKHLNTTAHTFVLNLRLDAAYNALILTDIHVDDLSLDLGYESVSHFQQIFKKKYGITPAALRKKHGSRTV